MNFSLTFCPNAFFSTRAWWTYVKLVYSLAVFPQDSPNFVS